MRMTTAESTLATSSNIGSNTKACIPRQYHTKSYITDQIHIKYVSNIYQIYIKYISNTYQILDEIQEQTQAISYDSPRGGVSQITEKGETTASFLLIQVTFL